MEQQSSAEAQPDYYDPYLHARQNHAWGPIDATPGLGSPSPSPPTPQRSHVSSAPVSRPSGAGADTPSSADLGIGSADPDAQFPGYYPLISRDSFQQDSSPPPSPPPAKDSQKLATAPQEYALGSSHGAAFSDPQHDNASPPPGGPGRPRSARLAQSKLWKMLSGGWPMYTMFCLGLAFAVGHDAFYTYLDGRPADDQIRMIRYGGVLSYAAKASLVAAVIFAYRQQVWVTVIRNVLQLKTIDSLFAAVNEPLTMLNWEFFKKAKVAVCLAVLALLLPLTVILTPATLTVALLTETIEDRCYNVRTLNFEQEKKRNWRMPEIINGRPGIPLSLWNSTVLYSESLVEAPFNTTFFDYWTDITRDLDRLAGKLSYTGGAIIFRDNVGLEICGGGWNCTYTVSFKAPGYKCSELARGRELDEDALERQGVLIDVGRLMPMGSNSYIASTNIGDYVPNQIDVSVGGVPIMAPPFPAHLGAFRTEPVLEIGYSAVIGPGDLPENMTDPRWDIAFEAVVFRCEHYVINYTVQFNYTSAQQITTVLKREYLYPVINTTFIPTKKAKDGTKDNTVATPESNYVLPIPDFENYRLTAAYHSIGKRMRSYLEGEVHYTPYTWVDTNLIDTPLIDTETYIPVPNLMSQIQNLYENLTLSLLSNPRFVVVSWAADPTQSSGNNNSTDPALSYPCVKTRMANAYVYKRRDLWITYGVAIGAACFAVVLGLAALSQNDFHVRDVHVSSVIAATRAPYLENLPWKPNKWGKVSDEILGMELGYGVVTEPGPNGTPATAAAMGSEWEVVSGKEYYGFAPREVLGRTRVAMSEPGKPRSWASAFSFRTWEQNYLRGR